MRIFFILLILVTSYHVKSQNNVIKNKKDLIAYAEPILFKKYGKRHIMFERPYVISFKKGIWVMEGTLPKGWEGGTFYIEINAKDGEVIQIVHFK
jgi:hypothetical protein